MGKVDGLRNRVEPIAALFWALLPTPDPVCRPGIIPPPYTMHVLMYMIIVGSMLDRDTLPTPTFSYLGVLFYLCLQLSRTV